MRFCVRAPLTPNPRVENLFERAFFCCVSKDYGAKLLSIQVAFDRKNTGSKLLADFVFNLRVKIDELVRNLIRVEKFGCGHDLAQTFAKAGLPRRNSAGNPDRRHDSGT